MLNQGAIATTLKLLGGSCWRRVTLRGMKSYCCASQEGTLVTCGTYSRPPKVPSSFSALRVLSVVRLVDKRSSYASWLCSATIENQSATRLNGAGDGARTVGETNGARGDVPDQRRRNSIGAGPYWIAE